MQESQPIRLFVMRPYAANNPSQKRECHPICSSSLRESRQCPSKWGPGTGDPGPLENGQEIPAGGPRPGATRAPGPLGPRLGLPRGPAVAEHGAPLGARMQIWFINDGRFGRPSIQQVKFEITYVRCDFLKTEVHFSLDFSVNNQTVYRKYIIKYKETRNFALNLSLR